MSTISKKITSMKREKEFLERIVRYIELLTDDIKFKYFIYRECRPCSVLAVAYIFESGAKVLSDKTFCARDKYIHSQLFSARRSLIYAKEAIFALVSSTVSSSVLLELNSVKGLRFVSPSLKYLSYPFICFVQIHLDTILECKNRIIFSFSFLHI